MTFDGLLHRGTDQQERQELASVLSDLQTQINALGPSGGVNKVRVTCSFGASFTDKAQTVVTGLTWVDKTTSCLSALVITPDGDDPDEMYLLDFQPVISDIVSGTGFTVTLYSQPEARGDYEVLCLGG